MKNFVTPSGVVTGVFTPAFVVVTEETAKSLDFKNEDEGKEFLRICREGREPVPVLKEG